MSLRGRRRSASTTNLQDYEGRPGRRPFSYDELETLFDFLDDRVDRAARSGRKGGLSALRDAQMVKTTYALGHRMRTPAQGQRSHRRRRRGLRDLLCPRPSR